MGLFIHLRSMPKLIEVKISQICKNVRYFRGYNSKEIWKFKILYHRRQWWDKLWSLAPLAKFPIFSGFAFLGFHGIVVNFVYLMSQMLTHIQNICPAENVRRWETHYVGGYTLTHIFRSNVLTCQSKHSDSSHNSLHYNSEKLKTFTHNSLYCHSEYQAGPLSFSHKWEEPVATTITWMATKLLK